MRLATPARRPRPALRATGPEPWRLPKPPTPRTIVEPTDSFVRLGDIAARVLTKLEETRR